jgi:Glycosyl transferase family 2
LTAPETVPELSVIVIVLGGGAHLVRCLQALARQEGAPAMEVIIPRDARLGDADCASLQQIFPGVRFALLPGSQSFAALRTAGAKAARGRIVAITEDQCIPPVRWCASAIGAHTQPHGAVGGPVDKQHPDRIINWAIYLRELGQYMPPVAEGASECLTDCNVTYKREVLDEIAPVWSKEFHEPEVHAALQARGKTLWLSPALLTYQQREIILGPAIRERYEFGRLYGGLRVAHLSGVRRLLLIALTPLLPVLMVWRVLHGVILKKRYIGVCLAALPYLILFAAVWSWGELAGYVTGRAAGAPAISG